MHNLVPTRLMLNVSALSRPAFVQRGFSLMEILVVITVIGLMLGLVSFSLGRGVSGAQMRNASKEVAASMRYTRSLAMRTHQQQVFLVDIENRTWQAGNRPPEAFVKGMDITILTARSELTGENAGGIRFFPDGSSTGGRVTLTADEREWEVGVEWLTGEITRGELLEK